MLTLLDMLGLSMNSPKHMLRHSKMALVVLLINICWLPALLSADIRCATVNMELLIVSYHQAAKEAEMLMKKQLKYRKELISLQQKRKQLEQSIKELSKKILQLETPPPKGSDIRNEYNTLVGEYQAMGKDLQELKQTHIRNIEKKLYQAATKSLHDIQAAVHQYAHEYGYQWVIDTSGASNTGMSPLIYARNAQDITKEVISFLNKDAPAETKKDGAKASSTGGNATSDENTAPATAEP